MSGYTILGLARSDGPSAPALSDADARASAVAYLDSLVGTDYIWAGKDISKSGGLDCSGAVVSAYEHAGLARPGARYKYGSADLHKKLQPTSNPKPGDLAFYGANGQVHHVMMVAEGNRVIGATGGGRNTKTVEDARVIGAAVKYKPIGYRKDLVGYGSAPTTMLEGSWTTKLDTSDSRLERAEKIGYGVIAAAFMLAGAGAVWWFRGRGGVVASLS